MAIECATFIFRNNIFKRFTTISMINIFVCTLVSASLDPNVEEVVKTLTSKIESNVDNDLMDQSLKFHVGLCRKICNGIQILALNESHLEYCPSFCSNCDCNVTCSFYGTCCPKVDVRSSVLETDIDHKIDSMGKVFHYFIGNISGYRLVDGNKDFTTIQSDPDLNTGLLFKDRFQCFKASWPTQDDGVQYFMISNCSPSESNETLRHLCETIKYDIDVFSSEFFTPVTNIHNGVTFKNIHCARCNYHDEYPYQTELENDPNGDNEFNHDWQEHITKWNIKIMCGSYQDLYKINSEEEFLKVVFVSANRNILFQSSHEHNCHLDLEPPLPITIWPRQCQNREVPENGVFQVGVPQDVSLQHKSNKTECSIHGPGSILYNLCQMLTARTFRYGMEKNAFCYLCNDIFPDCENTRYDSAQSTGNVISPLAFLLGSKSGVRYLSEDTNFYTVVFREGYFCNETMRWMDEEGMCQLPTCAEGKTLDVHSGTCNTVVSRINSLRYKYFMLLEPDWRIPANYTTNVYTILKEYFYFTIGASLNIHWVICNSQENDYVQFMKIDGSFQSHPNFSREEFENMVLFPKSDLNAKQSWNMFFNKSKIIFGHETTEAIINARYKQVYDGEFRYNILGHTNGPIFSPFNDPSVSVEAGYKTIITHNIHIDINNYIYNYGNLFGGKTDFIDINPSLVCPFVEMNLTNITADSFQEIQIGFFYNGSEHIFNASGFENKYSILNGKLRICIDTFRTEFQTFTYSLPTNETVDEISATKIVIRYLTLICLGVSVVSLVLTIITYALFESLRTQPGVNALTLSICLALAQLCLILVTILVGHIDGWFCQLIGIVLHYSWLAAFHWMNANCVYTFIVFNKIKARHTGGKFRKSFLKYSIYAFGISMVYIVLHMILSEVLSKGTSFGYSSELCLFDLASSNIPPIISFVIPLGIVVFIDGVLFSITVKRIMTLRKQQETVRSRKSRQEFLTYVKLSSLTGLFWSLAILAVHFDNEVLSIIYIPLVALQGLFIFLSFIANKKVKNLYLVLLGYEKEPGRSSAATANTYIKTSTT